MRSRFLVLVVMLVLSSCSRRPDAGVVIAPIVAADYLDTSVPSDFPFVVALVSGSGAVTASCTGTLIAPGHVLTAAHCVDNSTPVAVSFGAMLVSDAESDIVAVTGCVMHPGYLPSLAARPRPGFSPTDCGALGARASTTPPEFDFAVLTLEHPVPALRAGGAGARGAVSSLALVTRSPTGGFQGSAVGYGTGELAEPPDSRRVRGGPLHRGFRLVSLFYRVAGVLEAGGAVTRSGDSGGPFLTEAPDGSWRVVAVASQQNRWGALDRDVVLDWIRGRIDLDRNGSADFRCVVGARALLGLGAELRSDGAPVADASSDHDGDYVLDAEDTCPGVFNPCQLGTDADLDGVDDDCELCPGDPALRFTLAELGEAGAEDPDGDGVPTVCDCSPLPNLTDTDGDFIRDDCDVCRGVADTDQADCDGDGDGDACSADDDRDGYIDVCGFDSCVGISNPGQENCNRELEELLGRAAAGDACDATPCGETTVLARRERRGPGGRDIYAVMDRIEVDARAATGIDARLGMRFCACDAARADSEGVRDLCDAVGCLRDRPTLYDAGETPTGPWREVTMLWPSPEPGPAGGVNSLAPIAILGGVRPEVTETFFTGTEPFLPDLGPTWRLEPDDRPRWATVFAELPMPNSPLPGLMWTHAPGRPDGTDFVGDGRTLASHFWSGVVEAPTFLARTPIPCAARLGPFLGGESCPVCAASFPEAFIGVAGIPGPGGFCARRPDFLPWLGFGDGFVDGSGLVPFEPPQPGDPPRWIAAVEPTELLPALRYALLDAEGALLDTVSLSFGRLALDSKCGPNGCACPNPPCSIGGGPFRTAGASAEPIAEPVAVLSATTERLWLVGAPGTGASDGVIVELDLAVDGRRSALDVGLGTVLAATYLPSRDQLVVLDEVVREETRGRRGVRRVREARLLLVDLDTAETELVASWPRLVGTSRFALAPSADGTLYLAASRERGAHVVVRLSLDEGARALGVAGGPRPILPHAAHASRLGLSLGVEERDRSASVVGYGPASFRRLHHARGGFEDCF